MPTPANPPARVQPDLTDKVSRILDHARYCGLQEDGMGGKLELWTLRKPLGVHPAGSTITRATLERLLFS